jgi:ankyrin repeat protein
MAAAAASSAASSSAASSNRLLDAVRASDTATVRRLLHLEDEDDLAVTAGTERPSSHSPPANPNVADSDGSSALHWAGWVKNRAIFLALLRAGADPAVTNHRGESVLEWSLRGGDLSILSALLTLPDDAGEALLRSRNAHGGSCMHIAAEEGLLPAMAAFVLLRGGHDLLDARDARGKTPLMCAAHRSKPMVSREATGSA